MSDSTLSPGRRLQAGIISGIAAPLVGLLSRSLTWVVEGDEHYQAVLARGRQPILALWHGRIFGGLHHFRRRNVVVITSRNFDGEWIAGILRRLGYGSARGSTSRGGVRALAQMRRDLTAGRPVAFTLDGPRGPARVAQPGAIWLAGATGHPLLPFHAEASRHWTLNSWDRAQIPRPFARLALVIGSPIEVAGTDLGELEARRLQLEESLGRLERRCLALLRGTEDA